MRLRVVPFVVGLLCVTLGCVHTAEERSSSPGPAGGFGRPGLPPSARAPLPELGQGERVERPRGVWPRVGLEPSVTNDGVPVAGLVRKARPVSGAELCFDSAARLAELAPIAVGVSRGQPVRVFDAIDGRVLAKYRIPADEQDVISLDIDEEGERVVMLDLGYRVWLWDWQDGDPPRLVGALPLWEPAAERSLAKETIRFGPGSERIVVGQAHSGALLLDRDGLVIRRIGNGVDLTAAVPEELPGFVVDVQQTSWSEDGSRVLFLVDGRPRLLDARTGEEVAAWADRSLGGVEHLALSPDGEWVATVHRGEELLVTRVGDEQPAWRKRFHLRAADLSSPDQRELTERELRVEAHGLTFDRTGRTLAVVLGGEARLAILEASSGKVLGYSGRESSVEQFPCEVRSNGDGAFVLTALICGYSNRVMMARGGARVLHLVEEMATPPDFGWDGLAFFAGENSYHLVETGGWEEQWSVPIQDW